MKTSIRLDDGPVPLYFQLATRLRDRIRSGEFSGGVALPTEEGLCEEYGVSRVTVRHAMADLLAQRLITRRRGLGTFVSEPKDNQKAVSLVGSIHEALHYVKGLTYKQLSRKEAVPPPFVAELLQLQAKDKALYIQTIGQLKEGPMVQTDLYFPVEVGRLLVPADMTAGKPIVHVIEERLNKRVVRAEQLVEPDVADSTTAGLLGLKKGVPILRITRLFFLADGTPIEAAITRYHPERYKLHVELHEKPPT